MGEGQPLKKQSQIALAAMGLLLLGSIVFYKERILFSDSAYILFDIINYHSLAIQEHRYGSFITQLAPWLGQKIHMPVRAMLMAYSVSFNLFYFVVAALLIYRFRQYMLAIVMALYYFLLVSQSYFWVNDEIHQAVAWMFLLLGYTLGKGVAGSGKRITFFALFSLLCFLTIFTHFIVIIPLVFLWVFLWLGTDWPFAKKESWLLSLIVVATIAAKFTFTLLRPSWDSDHLHGVTHFSIKDIIQSFSTPVVTVFLQRCLSIYWPGTIVFTLGLAGLIMKKEWKRLLWVVVSFAGYLVIMGLTYAADNGAMALFHVESEWQCISIIMAAPFVFSFLQWQKQIWAFPLLVLVFSVRIYSIMSVYPLFHWRIDFQEQVFAQMSKKGITKLALYDDIPPVRAKYMLDWGAPYESLLGSAMQGEKPQRIFLFINRDNKTGISALMPDKFCTIFGALPAKNLNGAYFTIDTTHPYSIMSHDELMK